MIVLAAYVFAVGFAAGWIRTWLSLAVFVFFFLLPALVWDLGKRLDGPHI